jgi:hypothetical protein
MALPTMSIDELRRRNEQSQQAAQKPPAPTPKKG